MGSINENFDKGKDPIPKKEDKTIYIPVGFSDRDYFFQFIYLQDKYKLCLSKTTEKGGPKAKQEILLTNLALIVIAIKADLPRHLTENLYNRYKISLENLL